METKLTADIMRKLEKDGVAVFDFGTFTLRKRVRPKYKSHGKLGTVKPYHAIFFHASAEMKNKIHTKYD